MKIKQPLTVTKESLQLYEALLNQLKLNEMLQNELLSAADTIRKLTDELQKHNTG